MEGLVQTPSTSSAVDSPAKADDPERRGGIAPHPRIGIGLPMSKIFATCVFPLLSALGIKLTTLALQLLRRLAGHGFVGWMG